MRLDELNLKSLIGKQVTFSAIVDSAEVKPTWNKPYLLLGVRSWDVSLRVKFWNTGVAASEAPGFVGSCLDITANVELYEGEPSVIGIDMAESQLGPDDFKQCDPNPERSWAIICDYFKQFTDTEGPLYKITLRLFQQYKDAFRKSSAATSYHHNYGGGLVQHTSEVLMLSHAIGQTLGLVPDLYLAAAYLHDFEKIDEMAVDDTGKVEYTPLGLRLGHHYLGANLINITYQSLIQAGEVVPSAYYDDQVTNLQHILLAHHGSPEMGSSIRPAILEAWVVHHADCLSAESYRSQTILKHLLPGETATKWMGGIPRTYYRPLER